MLFANTSDHPSLSDVPPVPQQNAAAHSTSRRSMNPALLISALAGVLLLGVVIIAVIGVGIYFLTSGHGTSARGSGLTSTSSFNPYRGSLDALLPKVAGRFKLDGSHPVNYAGANEALEASYKSQDGRLSEVRIQFVNFPTAQMAEQSLHEFVSQRSGTPQPKIIKGGIRVGERYATDDGQTIVWTDGSLLCGIKRGDVGTVSDAALRRIEMESFEGALPF